MTATLFRPVPNGTVLAPLVVEALSAYLGPYAEIRQQTPADRAGLRLGIGGRLVLVRPETAAKPRARTGYASACIGVRTMGYRADPPTLDTGGIQNDPAVIRHLGALGIRLRFHRRREPVSSVSGGLSIVDHHWAVDADLLEWDRS